jgi:hypothetical protein
MPDKNHQKKKALEQLENLLEDHLAGFTPAERSKMHNPFEKRISNRRDSEAKTARPLRVGTR